MVLNSTSGVLTISRVYTWGASGGWENEFAHITTKIWVGRVTVHTEGHTNKMNIILVDIRSFLQNKPNGNINPRKIKVTHQFAHSWSSPAFES